MKIIFYKIVTNWSIVMCCEFSVQRMRDFWDDISKSSAYSAFAWDYCYDAFRNPNMDDDTKCIYLESYLGSFGMKVRDLFGRHTNHTVHKPAIYFLLEQYENEEELCFEKLCSRIKDSKPTDSLVFEYQVKASHVDEMVKELKKRYVPYHEAIETIDQVESISSITNTYLTKIMLATTSYTIGYDTYVREALKRCNNTSLTKTDDDRSEFHWMSLEGVYIFACQNKDDIKKCQKFMKTPSGQPYSIMRIVDIHFLLAGIEFEKKK